MSIALEINGVTYDYPEAGDTDWGPDATDWAAAVTSGMLQKAGGLFQLLADADFGTSFGLKSLYYKTRTANVADAGQFRLARADVINWRNQANSANLSLGVSASDVLQFNGADIQGAITVSDTASIDLTFAANTLSADIVAASITNAMISASAAIAFSKLATLTSGNILVGSAGNVATSVAMSGDATIIASGALTIANAAVSNAKMANMAESTIKGRAASSGAGAPVDLTATQATAILNNVVGDSGSGGTKGLVPAPAAGDAASNKFLMADGTWTVPPGAGDVVGPASSTDSGFAKFDGTTGKLLKDSAATIANADVAANAAIAFSKLATLTSANILVGNGSNVAASVAMSGAITIDNAGATSYNGTVPINKGGTGQTTAQAAIDALLPTQTGNAGEFLTTDATNASWARAPGRLLAVTTYANSGSPHTWTKADNSANYIVVEVQAGGGGGGGVDGQGASNAASGAGGGGGGYSKKVILAAALGATETVTVGAAGAAGAAAGGTGGTGGNSSFGAHATANGGVGGVGMTATVGRAFQVGGAGGAAASGTINIAGQAGGPSFQITAGDDPVSGSGGNSFLGLGGAALALDAGTTSTVGNNGTGYGGGGGGAVNLNTTANAAGGAGAEGVIIVWEYA